MLHNVLRGRWCDIIFLNVQASMEDKSDDKKHSFCEELGRVVDQFIKYHMNMLLEDLNAEVGNESLHEINNDIQKSNCQEYNVTSPQHS
jgi:hypothetical protein